MLRDLRCASVTLVWIGCQALHAATITGTVYDDLDLSGSYNGGEGVARIVMQIYEDDGDGVLGVSDAQFGSDIETGVDGVYRFSGLDPLKGYFVVQPEQRSSTQSSFAASVSQLFVPRGPVLMIDDFLDSQSNVVTPLAHFSGSIARSTNILGGERDAYLQFLTETADSKLRSNPYGLNDVLDFDQSAAVGSVAILTWDGVDGVANAGFGLGLGGIDLSDGGLNTGFELSMGIDAAGAGDTFAIRMYEGTASNYSEVVMPIPVTDGTASGSVIVPFSSFKGPVKAVNVDAIQLTLGGQGKSIDMQSDFLGVSGPHVKDVALTRVVPEPATVKLMLIWAWLGLLGYRRDSRLCQSAK